MTTFNFASFLGGLAAVLLVIGFTYRNQLWLRTYAVMSGLCFLLYFFLATSQPLWPAIVLSAAIIAVNVFMMSKLMKDNSKFRLSAEEMMLYARLPGLTPGEYKQLLAIAEWHNPKAELQLTEEGAKPEALHYVLEGKVKVQRNGKVFSVGPHAFIGELAFLREKPATATTHAEPGALVVSWKQQTLRNLMKSNDGIRKALDGLLSVDMADKIARNAAPVLQEQAG